MTHTSMALSEVRRPPVNSQSSSSGILTASHTNLAYDLTALSPTSQWNVRKALCDDNISMVRCFERDDDYHFEVQERACITVSDGKPPTCSVCPFDKGRACRHVWWIDDQILDAAVPAHLRRYQLQISRDGQEVMSQSNQEVQSFYDMLENGSLDKLALHKKWWYQDAQNQNDVMLVEQAATDILSAFEPRGFLYGQHGQVNFEMLQWESQALFTRYREEMIKQAKSQPFLLIALKAAVPEHERDLLLLAKLHSRIERVFFDYEYWLVTRKSDDSNVEKTARALREEIKYLQSFITDRRHQKMTVGPENRVVDILLYTLEQVVTHAGDVESTSPVDTPQYSGLDQQDRNLLHKMVNLDTVFVLDVLRLVDQKVLQSGITRRRVEELASLLESKNANDTYTNTLKTIAGIEM